MEADKAKADGEQPKPMTTFFEFMLFEVITYLDNDDIMSMAQTCRQFRFRLQASGILLGVRIRQFVQRWDWEPQLQQIQQNVEEEELEILGRYINH